MGCDVGGFAADSAHWVAVVAIVKKDGGVRVESFELFGGACALAVVVHAFANGEVLILAANDSTECNCCNNWHKSVSRSRSLKLGSTYSVIQARKTDLKPHLCLGYTRRLRHLHHP